MNVSAAILSNTLIGPFIIEERVRGEDCLNSVADVVMPMFDDNAFTVTASMVSTRRCSSTFHTSSTPIARSPFSRQLDWKR